jgi:hypothetical protein
MREKRKNIFIFVPSVFPIILGDKKNSGRGFGAY